MNDVTVQKVLSFFGAMKQEPSDPSAVAGEEGAQVRLPNPRGFKQAPRFESKPLFTNQ